jgi:phosphate transport system permease protein
VAIFVYLLYKGASSLNLAFFTKSQAGGRNRRRHGQRHRRLGDSARVASVIGVPIGIGGGIFLAEFGRGTKLANAVRFTADVLNGVPSIVMGLAAYSLIVRSAGGTFRPSPAAWRWAS